MSSLGLSDITAKVQLLIQTKAKHATARKVEKIRADVVQTIKSWRLHVRFLLSRKYKGGRNYSLWPRLRTGALRASVPTYEVTTRKTFSGSKTELNETVIQIKHRPYKKPWETYGRELNQWSSIIGQPSSLDGWQDRAYDMLDKQILNKIGGIVDYNET